MTDDFDRLKTLKRPELLAFSVACADRLSPLFREYGAAEHQVTYARILDSAWRIGGGLMTTEVAEMLATLKALPEYRAAELGLPEKSEIAGETLDMLTRAIEIVHKPRATKVAWSVACTGAELLSGIDFVLTYGPKAVRFINPRNPPKPGPLEAEEEKLQRWSISLLSQKGDKLVSVEKLRQKSMEARAELSAVLDAYSRACGWPIRTSAR